MNRRHALSAIAGGLGALTFAPGTAFAQATCSHSIDCLKGKDYYPVCTETFEAFYKHAPLSYVSMPRHDDPSPFFMFFDRYNIEAMKRANVKIAVLEFDPAYQPLFDALAERRIAPAVAAMQLPIGWLKNNPRHMSAVANIIARGSAYMGSDIRILCRDVDKSTQADRENFRKYMITGGEPDLELNGRIMDARNDDRLRADLIKADIAALKPGERAVVMHGGLHFENHAHNLKSELNVANAPQMNIYGSAALYMDTQTAPEYKSGDFICLADEGNTGRLYCLGNKKLALTPERDTAPKLAHN